MRASGLALRLPVRDRVPVDRAVLEAVAKLAAVIAAATREEAIRATTEFMQLHLEHWPGWEGECELRELVFLAPE